MSPPQAARVREAATPPIRMRAVIKFRCVAPISGKKKQTDSEVAKIAIANQVLRRSLTSTSGAHKKTNTPGKVTIELMLAIRSTGTPAWESRNGKGVELKPMIIPSGRMSRLNTQGVGHRRALGMLDEDT